jgi:hypothetical protein
MNYKIEDRTMKRRKFIYKFNLFLHGLHIHCFQDLKYAKFEIRMSIKIGLKITKIIVLNYSARNICY